MRIEDLSLDLVRCLCDVIEHDPPDAKIIKALQTIPKDTNTSGPTNGVPLDWDTIPNGEEKNLLMAMSTAFGYSTVPGDFKCVDSS